MTSPWIDVSVTLSTIPDARDMRAWIARMDRREYSETGFQIVTEAPRAVVIGGGFIGIEMVENLAHLGFDVTPIEKLDQVLSREVLTSSGTIHPADIAILAIGVRPEKMPNNSLKQGRKQLSPETGRQPDHPKRRSLYEGDCTMKAVTRVIWWLASFAGPIRSPVRIAPWASGTCAATVDTPSVASKSWMVSCPSAGGLSPSTR